MTKKSCDIKLRYVSLNYLYMRSIYNNIAMIHKYNADYENSLNYDIKVQNQECHQPICYMSKNIKMILVELIANYQSLLLKNLYNSEKVSQTAHIISLTGASMFFIL